jgi:hypothetical protein
MKGNTASVDVMGLDAGPEKNNEEKGFMPAFGFGNLRDPENGVITVHTGIRGNVDAAKDWNWDVTKPVAHVTITLMKPLNVTAQLREVAQGSRLARGPCRCAR